MTKFDKAAFKKEIQGNARKLFRRELKDLSEKEACHAVAAAVQNLIIDDWICTQKAAEKEDQKRLYYLSMEFLMGRALGNNILNLSAHDGIRDAISELGLKLNALEDSEPDWALGNGGLGRLAACFLDSLASLGYWACGCGIRYKYGFFKQQIVDGFQREAPDDWLRDGNPFEIRRSELQKEVRFGGWVETVQEDGRLHFIQRGYQSVLAIPYDTPVVGYNNHIVDTLRVWDAQAKDIFHLEEFDKGNYQKAVESENMARNIAEVLYPNDNHYAGKELRLRQQYFFISASVQTAVADYAKRHEGDVHRLYEKVAFQMNDTHPTVAVAELMRILMDDYGLNWDEAWEITVKSCAYTNHTIMAEALEKWPIELFSKLLPRIYQIVEEINRRFCELVKLKYPEEADEKTAKMAVVYDGQVRMAHLAIVGSHAVNGVAELHTEILETQELKDFYEMSPERFSNKTNGISQRRWLLHANPELADWVTDKIGDGWLTDLPKLKKLSVYADDERAQAEFMAIKRRNKERLAAYVLEHNGMELNVDSVFDVMVKRLHEYKRQLMNILHIMYVYNQLKDHPDMEFYPHSYIFGAKAAAGYRTAKLTIKLINNVAEVINNDHSINGKIKIVFIEDYRVSNAEIIIPAADISEQISTASKEASGTSNMKLMLNGALTLGTMDGANVEIVKEVGEENAFIFGMSSDEVIALEHSGDYRPMDIFNNDQEIRRVLMQLVNGFYSPEDPELFRPLYDSLLNTNESDRPDRYFILKDFYAYAKAQEEAVKHYQDEKWWARAAILNTANAGKFSSDRTIEEYVKDIWHLNRFRLKK